ncbi:MAG: right-handed parallel beta-helix repeat-containing protein [Planctomycetaceae bacterium]
MKAILKKTLLSLVGCLALWSPAYGQGTASSQANGVLSDGSAGRVVMSNTVGTAVATPFGNKGFLSGTWGQGPGYDADQVNVGVMIPKHIDPGRSLFMLMLQGSVTEDGDGVGKVGMGYRYYAEELDRMFGIATWYTTDDSGNGTYDAIGLSLENIGRHFSMQLNGNFVTNDDATLVSRVYDTGNEFFFDNYIGVTRTDTWETPYHYTELLFGTPLPVLGRYGVTAHVGPYGLFNSDADNYAGVKVKVEAHLTEDIRVNTNYTNDSLTGSSANVNVSFAFPHRRSSRWFRQTPIQNRLGDWWSHPDRVNAVISQDTENVPLTNPKDNEPIYVVHLNPNATSTGDGTYENPYNNILAFTNQAYIDIIRVVPNEDGTAAGLQNNGSLDLFDCQRLLGSSIEHIVDAVEYSFVLPDQTGDALPIMENLFNDSNDSVVQLANMNEVSGIHINGAGVLSNDHGDGITNQPGGIMDFNVNRNLFTNYRNGMELANVSGIGLLTANEFDGSNPDVGGSDNGFFLINTQPLVLDLFSTENNFHENGDNGSLVIADAGTINITELNNTSNLNGTGFGHRASTGATINQLSFSNNSANENTSTATGAVWDADGGFINIERYFGNEHVANLGSGAVLSASLGGDIILRGMDNNNFSQNGTGNGTSNPAHGLQLIADGAGSTIDAEIGQQNADNTLLPNVMADNGQGTGLGDGINLTATDGAVIDALLTNNEATGNGDDGLGIFADQSTINAGDATHFITDNVFSNNDGAGIEIVAQGGGIAPPATDVNVWVFDSTITNNAEGGIVALGSGNNSDIELQVGQSGDGNTITGNGEVGVGVSLEDTATASLRVYNNSSISGTTTGGSATPWNGDGVGVFLIDDSELTVFEVLNNGGINNNASNGIDVQTYTQSILELGFIDNNNISGNTDNGIFYLREGESILDNQFMFDNNITGNGNGIHILTRGGSTDFRDASLLELNFVIGDGSEANLNNISNNSNHGILLHSTVDANQVTNINRNTVNNNGADGLHGMLGFFASLSGVWQNNTFNNNGDNGMNIVEGDFTQVTKAVYNRGANTVTFVDRAVNVDILDNFFDSNNEDGLRVAVTGEYDIFRNEFTNNGFHGMEFFVPGSQQNPQALVAPSIVVRAGQNLTADNTGTGILVDNSMDNTQTPPPMLDPIDGGGLFIGTFIENQVLRNGYDGVSVWTDDNDETLIDFIDMLVANNGAYGYRIQNYDDDRRGDAIVAGGADAFSRINISGTNNVTATQGNGGNSRVDNNGLGGIYVVNSSQDTFSVGSATIAQSILDLRVFQTAIRGNGTASSTFDDLNNPFFLTGGVIPGNDPLNLANPGGYRIMKRSFSLCSVQLILVELRLTSETTTSRVTLTLTLSSSRSPKSTVQPNWQLDHC